MGDTDDPQTKRWGIKKHQSYEIIKKKPFGKKGIDAMVTLNNDKVVRIPYENENAFGRNWSISRL